MSEASRQLAIHKIPRRQPSACVDSWIVIVIAWQDCLVLSTRIWTTTLTSRRWLVVYQRAVVVRWLRNTSVSFTTCSLTFLQSVIC